MPTLFSKYPNRFRRPRKSFLADLKDYLVSSTQDLIFALFCGALLLIKPTSFAVVGYLLYLVYRETSGFVSAAVVLSAIGLALLPWLLTRIAEGTKDTGETHEG